MDDEKEAATDTEPTTPPEVPGDAAAPEPSNGGATVASALACELESLRATIEATKVALIALLDKHAVVLEGEEKGRTSWGASPDVPLDGYVTLLGDILTQQDEDLQNSHDATLAFTQMAHVLAGKPIPESLGTPLFPIVKDLQSALSRLNAHEKGVIEVCPLCGGSGKTAGVGCPTCRGHGKVRVR